MEVPHRRRNRHRGLLQRLIRLQAPGDPPVVEFSTPIPVCHRSSARGLYKSQQRFACTLAHHGPGAFREDLRVTIQALAGRGRPLSALQDDIAFRAFWYQREPHAPFPALPDRDFLAVN